MPRYASSDYLPMYDAAELLRIFPLEERTCAGYAKTRHRRCHNPISAANANTASSLLMTISHDMSAGWDVDDLLEDLAHLVLCRSQHQYQAAALASVWSEKTYKFQARVTHTSMATSARQQTETSRQQLSLLQHTQTQSGSLELRNTRYTPEITPRSVSPRSLAPPSTTTYQVPPTGRESDSSETPVAGNIRTSSSSPQIPLQISTTSTASTTSTTSAQAPKRSIEKSPSTKQVTRRSIDNDCGICLMPLLKEKNVKTSDDNDNDDETVGATEHKQDSPLTAGKGPSDRWKRDTEGSNLEWCKAQCGTNYHTGCIEEWIQTRKSSPNDVTCPTCRCVWK